MKALIVLMKNGGKKSFPEGTGVVVEAGTLAVRRRGGTESEGGWTTDALLAPGTWVEVRYEEGEKAP